MPKCAWFNTVFWQWMKVIMASILMYTEGDYPWKTGSACVDKLSCEWTDSVVMYCWSFLYSDPSGECLKVLQLLGLEWCYLQKIKEYMVLYRCYLEEN